MACRFTYNGKTYDQDGLARALRDMPPSEASKFIPGINALPDAPFVGNTENWASLAMKRIINYAVRGGYDKVAWTPGDVQAARYDLSKHVDAISYDPVHKRLSAWKKTDTHEGGWGEILDKIVQPDDLDKHIGKDAAKKLLASPKAGLQSIGGGRPFQLGEHVLEGEDLKVGGEGMKGFYDKILPAAVNKLVKKHGAKVGQAPMSPADNWRVVYSGPNDYRIFDDATQDYAHGKDLYAGTQFTSKDRAEKNIAYHRSDAPQVHTVDITPSLRKSAMEQGFPQFAKGGAVKVTKASVNYSKGMPKSHCGICTFYRNHTCTKVQGSIDPAYWCELFEKQKLASGDSVKLTPVGHNPFETKPAIRRAIHGN